MSEVTASRSKGSWVMKHLTVGMGVGLLLLLTGACLSDRDSGVWAHGRILQINVSNLQRVQEVGYTTDGSHYSIHSANPGNTLVTAKVLVRNNHSALVSLFVNEEAVFLVDRQGNRYGPLDPYQQRQEVTQPVPQEQSILPLLWGALDVVQSYQVEGWLVFEVPAQFELNHLNWEQVDAMRVALRDAL